MRRTSLVDRREEFDVTMTPMIDVVFLLLIFFVWTASFQIAEELLPGTLSLPPAGKGRADEVHVAPQDDFDPVVVRIQQRGARIAWQLQGNAIEDLGVLRKRLVAIAEIRRDVPLIIHPDGDVPLGSVIEVYDAARSSGFHAIRFATPQREAAG